MEVKDIPISQGAAVSVVPAPGGTLWMGWGMALLSTVIFSLAPTLSKAAIELGTDPTLLLSVRLAITTTLIAVTVGFTRPERLRIDRRGLTACVVAGLANGVGMVTFFLSLARIDSSVASMIFSLSPLVLLALLALRGEKFTHRNTVRMALGLAGVYLLIGPGGQIDGMGILMAFGAVITVPIQLLIMQWYLQDHDIWAVTFYMVATMAVVAAGWWLVQGIHWQNPSWTVWMLILFIAVFCTYFSRLAMFIAIRHLGSGQVGLLAPLETLLTVVWSTLLLSERLSPIQWVGGGLILVSALLAVRRLGRVRWPNQNRRQP